MSLTGKQEAFARAYTELGNAWFAAHDADIQLMPVPPSSGYYVYILVRPDTDEIVYVGKGKNNRMFQHVRDVRAGRISGLKKYQGLSKLMQAGVVPQAYTIFIGLNEHQAYELERKLIRSIGKSHLLNSGSGIRNADLISLQRLDDLIRTVRPKAEWLSYAAKRKDLPPELCGEAFYDKLLDEMQETRASIIATIAEKIWRVCF